MKKIGKIMMAMFIMFIMGMLVAPVIALNQSNNSMSLSALSVNAADDPEAEAAAAAAEAAAAASEAAAAASEAAAGSGLKMPGAGSVGYESTETDFVTIVENITKWMVGFIVLIAIFMFAYGGLTYMTAGGDETKVDTAKKALTSAIFGLVIAALAYAVVNLIITFVTTGG